MGIGDWVSGIFGSTNKEHAGGYKVDQNAYHYGGGPGGAEYAANGYDQTAANAANRQGPQATNLVASMKGANGWEQQSAQARQGQQQVAGMSLARALGQVPSIAQQQADRQMQQAQAAQASMAGSARGAGALANAQRNAANNVANAQSDISGQAQINAGNERLAAEQSAAGQYGNIRGGDQASQMQSANQSLARNAQNVQQNQFNAGLRSQTMAMNDQKQLGYDQMANDVRTKQLAAQQNAQAQQSSNALGAQGINAGVGGQNASMNQSNAMNLIGMGQQAAGALAGIPGKATGGPVQGGKPYVVGERGPELIVPPSDGVVIPNHMLGVGNEPAPSADSVLRTWGAGPKYAPASTGLGDAFAGANQASANAAHANQDRAGLQNSGPLAVPGFSGMGQTKDEPLRRRDNDTLASAGAKQAQGIDLDEREAYEAQGAEYRSGKAKKGDRAEKKRTLASLLSDSGAASQTAAKGIDTSYHGGHGYTAPQLIPMRAMGGPVMGGSPAIVGEQGPEMLVPMSGPGSGPGASGAPGMGVQLGAGGGMTFGDVNRAATGLAGQTMRGMVGGGGITGGAQSGGATIPGYGGAREEGGPVEQGKTYLVGERGPEVVARNPFAGVRAFADAPTGPLSPESHEQEARIADLVARKNAQEAMASPGVGAIIPSLASLIGSADAASHRYIAPAIEKRLAGDPKSKDLFADEEKRKSEAAKWSLSRLLGGIR